MPKNIRLITLNLFLALIICFAAVLRLYQLPSTPISLNPDELAIGYNAYSYLVSGADEWGNKIPLAYKSFGDWKLPIYPIASALFIKILNLSELSVRLPSAIAGIISVFLIYQISLIMFRRKALALISSLFMCISPWMVFFSRGAYEPNLALCFLLAGLYLFLKYMEDKSGNWSVLGSAIFFGLTLFTYHPFLIFTPLFVLILALNFRKELKAKPEVIASAGIFLLFSLASLYSLSQGSGQKLSTVGIFNNADVVYRRSDKMRNDGSLSNSIFEKLLHNKYEATSYELSENYLSTFSPAFLFDGKTTKLFYYIGGSGYLYIVDALFIFIGVIGLVKNKEKFNRLLLMWLIIAPIPSAITIESPSVTRLIQIVPLFILVGSYGLYYISHKSRTIPHKLLTFSLYALLFLNFVYFINFYFNHLNFQNALFYHYGYKQAVQISNDYPGYKIVMVGPENFPYISFLFYNKIDPKKFRDSVSYYPPTKDKFYLVKSFNNYTFVNKIDRKKLSNQTLYIDNYNSKKDKSLKKILLPGGEPIFSYFTKSDIQR